MTLRSIFALFALLACVMQCEGRGKRLDTCTPCKEMLRQLIEETLPHLCNFAQCMAHRHGKPHSDLISEDITRHSGGDHITFDEMYENANRFALELEVIKKDSRDGVVDECFNQNLQDQLMKIICILRPTQLERGNSQRGCKTRLPKTFKNLDRSAKIDYVMHFLTNAYRQLSEFVRVRL